ncbi:CidA/LrgA family protein [Roseomonas elaeocarpi]|uniref:CidA/LrgA family protein n=1 Tax=Roseomonas elaeocarpi TaxID=907779 RepID=A0ABV6K0U9_9PROT
MVARALVGRWKHEWIKRWWLQTAFFILLSWLGDQAVRLLHLPMPGSIVALLAMLLLLLTRTLSVEGVRRGALKLQDHLMLFFVPPMLALLDHPELLSFRGVEVLAVVLLGTVAVLLGTGLAVERFIRRLEPQAQDRTPDHA